AGADESRSRESANGHAQLAPAPPPERPSPVLGAWASGSEHVIEHCHGQLLIWKRISARAYEDGVCVAARLAQRREHGDGDQNDADRGGGPRSPSWSCAASGASRIRMRVIRRRVSG